MRGYPGRSVSGVLPCSYGCIQRKFLYERDGYMKKKILAIAVITACLATLASGTLAYFTSSETAHNVITSGGIDIAIIETQADKETGTEIPYPDKPITGVMPGESVSKIVTVKNLENSGDAWIRVMVNITGQFADGTAIMPDQLGVIGFEPNLTYWEFDEEEGYYYHKQPVGSGELTAPLFKEVKFAPEMGNEYQNCTVFIDVAADAVQSDNNPIPEGGDVTDIEGWPEGMTDEETSEETSSEPESSDSAE